MTDLGVCMIRYPNICLVWATNEHHRKLRSQGGTDEGANLIPCCGSGTTGCHGHIHANPAESYERGWLVKSWQDPADVYWTHWKEEG
jgi:hypothetical protein